MNDFLRKKLEYDSSCVAGNLPTVGSLVGNLRLCPVDSDAEETGFDVDEVRRAREDLWRRIPKIHRAAPAVLAGWVRDARLLAQIAGWDFGSPCLLMCGPTGCGKSTAAALVVIRTMAKGLERNLRNWKGTRWVGANELTNSAREWPMGSGECPEIRQAKLCRLLVLDDLGNETETAGQTTVFDVLQKRSQLGLPNIVTTGLRPRQLLERYGDAILRRIMERDGAMGAIVDCWSDK